MSQTKVEAPFVEGGGGSSFKNLLINGDMQIWQRGTAATASSGGYFTVDRWKLLENSDGAITSEQSELSTADKATTGCRNALLIKCTSTDTSISSTQYCYTSQALEGQFLSHLGWGTTSAKTLTLSFWVKAYVAATYTIFIKKYDNTDYYIPIEYTVNSSNTWEKKTIIISPTSGSTSLITGANGAFDQDNGVALLLGFGLTWGSSYHGTSGTWSSSTHFSTSNQTNFLSSTSNTFYLTGVQLEVGDQATDLEQVPFDVQLHRCKRYYQLISNTDGDAFGNGAHYGANSIYMSEAVSPEMRTTPTLDVSGGTNYFRRYSAGNYDDFNGINLDGSSGPQFIEFFASSGDGHTGGTQGHACFLRLNNASASFAYTAEL